MLLHAGPYPPAVTGAGPTFFSNPKLIGAFHKAIGVSPKLIGVFPKAFGAS
jgi:hypothetical protein